MIIRNLILHLLLEELSLDTEYKFDKSVLNKLIDNARKFTEQDFVETYIEYNDFCIPEFMNKSIKEGDVVHIVRDIYKNGKRIYGKYSPYKVVIAEKDYTDNWKFILDHTKDLQTEAIILYRDNKNILKPKFKKSDKLITGYHASPNKFKHFIHNETKTSGQMGANTGFFFFTDIKFANYYASVIKDNDGHAYIYECNIKLGNSITEHGQNIGTNWGRAGWLDQAMNEGYDTVIIKNADTGYGITDEIVVFDDDNIQIKTVTKL